MLSERNAIKRQSAVLINNAMSDAKLAEALLEIEELTKKVDQQQEQIKIKVGITLILCSCVTVLLSLIKLNGNC